MVSTSPVYKATLAKGVSPCLLTASSVAMTTADAPSQTPLAFPAETVPPFLNTDGSFASCSNVTSGLGCSSTRNCFTPLRVLISMGHISLSNFPASVQHPNVVEFAVRTYLYLHV